jgi:signal transduction histidine kinase
MLPKLTEQESRETFYTLNRQNKRLSTLVADLLMLSHLDWQLMGNSSVMLKQEKICIKDLVSDVVEELAPLALSSQITLETQIKFNYPLEIMGDVEKIYRLLFNIVSNSIQYTLAHGKVTVTLDYNYKFAVIIVEDTGIGIDSQHINEIFNRFYRIDKARSRREGGSGLGLSISKAIAQAHQGSIQIQSEINRGTRVIIQLPI